MQLRCGESRELAVSAAGPDADAPVHAVVLAPDSPGAVLVGEEHGLEIEWRSGESGDWHPVNTRPPRYGTFAVAVDASAVLQLRALPAGPRVAAVRLQLFCGDAQAAALPACLADPAAPARSGEGAWCRALRLHEAANAANRAGDLNAALQRYEEATQAWLERGDGLRAAAAQLGRAESLLRLNRFAEAQAAAGQAAAANQRAKNPYFAARARNEACVALRELGRRTAARRCQAALPPLFIALGETSEAANSYYNLASMAQEDGLVVEAARWLHAARLLDRRRVAPEIGARLDLIEGGLEAGAGNLAAALAAFERAAEVFERTRNGRWLGIAYLRMGMLYSQVGAWSEAEAAVREALAQQPATASAARHADALRHLARIQFAAGQEAAAKQSYATAQALLAAQDAPIAMTVLELDQALRGDAAALARATVALSTDPAGVPRLRARLALAQAGALLREGKVAQALAASRNLAADRLALADYLRLKILQARALGADGKSSAALALLQREIAALRGWAGASSAAGLRQIAGRHLGVLRSAWIDIYLDLPPAQRPPADLLWNMLCDTALAAVPSSRTAHELPSGEGGAANRELAQVLLEEADNPAARPGLNAQRALQRYYAALDRVAGPRAEAAMAQRRLAQLQAGLDEGDRLLVFGFGTRAGVLLTATRKQIAVHEVAAGSAVRSAAAALREAAATDQTPMAVIREAAARLSGLLLGDLQSTLPRRLLVLADPALDGVPWGLLTWPGQDDWLVATTPVALFAAEPQAQRPRLAMPARVGVLVADSQGDAVPASLPRLHAAALEPDWIAQALPQVAVLRLADSGGGRKALAEAIATEAAWVHVAAHGMSGTRLQSYSGIWLAAAEPGQPPQLYSWLDVADRPARAALVVLDACALAAADPRASSGAASLAAALNGAGAQQVIAALWPVSDGAARIWVPAFYSALAAQETRDAGEALRQAQLRLRGSLHFRHPFYWASWVHFTR